MPALITLVCVGGAMAVVAFLSARSGTEQGNGAGANGATAWPYGTPEYVIEVPSGYEALLPVARTAPTQMGGAKTVAPETEGTEGTEGMEGTENPAETAMQEAPAQGTFPEGESPAPTLPAASGAEKKRGGVLMIVIDDAGYNLKQLDAFLKLPFPLSVAVLPGLPDTAEAGRRVLAAGKELLLHQPMQALGGQNPGPGAVSLDMTPEEVKTTVAKNLDELPGAAGLNNHMGSAVTRDRILMEPVIELAKERGIYYLDSLTTPDTVVREASLGLDMHPWERDVFLDNAGDRSSILNALTEGKRTASSKGSAVMIGHVWSTDLARTLMEVYPQLVAEGYSLSTISRYMMLEAAQEGSADDATAGN